MNEENKDISYNESAAGAQEESTRAPEIQPEAQPEQSPDTGAEPAANPFGEGKCADFLESLCSGKASVLFTPVSSVNLGLHQTKLWSPSCTSTAGKGLAPWPALSRVSVACCKYWRMRRLLA